MFYNVEVYEEETGILSAFYFDEAEGLVGMSKATPCDADALAQDYAAVAIDGFDPCDWEETRRGDDMRRAYRECTEEGTLIAASGIGEYYAYGKGQRQTFGVRRDECGRAGLLFALALMDEVATPLRKG